MDSKTMISTDKFVIQKKNTLEQFIEDPYASPLYQASMLKREEKIFVNTDNESAQDKQVQIHMEIKLIKGSVEVHYNPDVFKFSSEENRIVFSREINSFFINNDFRLDSILFPVSVYRCGTRASNITPELVYFTNDDVMSNCDINPLNLVISRVLQRSIFKLVS